MVCAQASGGTTCRKKRTRTIVNVSSVDGSIATNRTAEIGEQAGMQLAYCSSKAALNMRALQRTPVLAHSAFLSRVHIRACRRISVAHAF
jgi:NAD(P)-dependent dehydrogenase (short-subunit alcohol dehydrogenase family)